MRFVASHLFFLKFQDVADRNPLCTEKIKLFKGYDSKHSKNQVFQLVFSCSFYLKKVSTFENIPYGGVTKFLIQVREDLPHPVNITVIPLGLNQDCVCEEDCCLSDAHFTHRRSLKLCSECGRALLGRRGEQRLFFLKS